MGAQQILEGQYLVWDLMKFCKGYKASEIEIHAIRNNENVETKLSHWEGKSKSEKIATLAGVLEARFYEDVDIILPDCRSYTY